VSTVSTAKKKYNDLGFWFGEFMNEFSAAESAPVIDDYLGTNLSKLEETFPNASFDFIGTSAIDAVEIEISCFDLTEKDDIFKFAFGRQKNRVVVVSEDTTNDSTCYNVNIKLSKYQRGMLSRNLDFAMKTSGN